MLFPESPCTPGYSNHHTTDIGFASETGLLTRWVPLWLKHSAFYRWTLRIARLLQFLSAVISLGIFSARFHNVYRLVNAFKPSHGVNRSYGAVEGILAAAVLYTLMALVFMTMFRGGGPKVLRWVGVALDIVFTGAFIAVLVLTRPEGGDAGPQHCYNASGSSTLSINHTTGLDRSCSLTWGTFILAVISIDLHAITAAFHEVRDRFNQRDSDKLIGPAGDRYAAHGIS
ncbi:hypothetical protein S40285_04474 [Stachybotrys chlorohalonatus IBT 40285]|uniref:MARVEL domain-containing protein n=1 Tax=Stachybotrys chlorohalonatus (strain IBT 40285) TaxID=1283841 RepID=A0A084QIP9_STAC4|nr:hypothetical protein S40285_04474 [Stachybotrys chlorohalonata IBT 40285]